MQLLALIGAAASLAGLASAAPAVAVRADAGFPAPNAQQLQAINRQADGTLAVGGPTPPPLNKSSIATFQLIAFNELFEVAFFTSLIQNITTGNFDAKFRSTDRRDELVSVLETVLAVSAPPPPLPNKPPVITR